ncbi:U-box domain-containing protein 7 [Nymphaea thermarum]|nr:U-box domain-containing protein 7 [Nymphaea thermarum]
MYIKLRFFIRIRRFIGNQAGKSYCTNEPAMAEKAAAVLVDEKEENGSEELLVDMKAEGDEEEAERVSIDDGLLSTLQRSVKELHFGGSEEKERAAVAIKRLASGCLQTRRSLAQLGVIPPLVAMLVSKFSGHRISALQALIEIGNGNYTNKALMVEAGILPKLSALLQREHDQPGKQELATLLLSLSTIADAQGSMASTPIMFFLINMLDPEVADEKTMEACLESLYNISTVLDNSEALVCNGAVPILMKLLSEKAYAERSLAILGNLAVTVAGKNAIESQPMVPDKLIEVISWDTKPKSQELAAYILMILAHKSSFQRDKMAEAGIVPALLELSLLGSPLAQKRALRILHWFKEEKMTRTTPHSGPQMGELVFPGSPLTVKEMNEGRRAIRKMVQESLHKNMESIMKRAKSDCSNAPDASKMKGLAISTSSKSLPY